MKEVEDGFVVNFTELIAHYDEELGMAISALLEGKTFLAICVTLAGQLGSKASYNCSETEWNKLQPTLHFLIKDAGDFTQEQLREAGKVLN